MMKKCWDADPSKRPTILELWEFAENKLKEIYGKENLKNNMNNKKEIGLFKKIFKLSKNKKHAIDLNQDGDNINDIGDTRINNDSSISNKSQQLYKSHPLAYHTSRILDNDITKSKELYYNSNNSSLNDLDINSIILNIDLNKGKLKIH